MARIEPQSIDGLVHLVDHRTDPVDLQVELDGREVGDRRELEELEQGHPDRVLRIVLEEALAVDHRDIRLDRRRRRLERGEQLVRVVDGVDDDAVGPVRPARALRGGSERRLVDPPVGRRRG